MRFTNFFSFFDYSTAVGLTNCQKMKAPSKSIHSTFVCADESEISNLSNIERRSK